MTGPANDRISPLNSTFSSVTRVSLAASASTARPSSICRRSIETPFEVEAEFRKRPGDVTGAVEAGRKLRPLQPRLGDAPFAAHQRAQRKLDA